MLIKPILEGDFMLEIETFGCKLNHYDSLIMQKHLARLSFDRKIKLINSCAVTAQAGKDIRRRAEKIKAHDSKSLVVVVGCGAQVETELYEKNSAVDLVVGNSERKNLSSIIESFLLEKSQQNKQVEEEKINSFFSSEKSQKHKQEGEQGEREQDSKELSKELVKDISKESSQGLSQESSKDISKEPANYLPKEPAKEMQNNKSIASKKDEFQTSSLKKTESPIQRKSFTSNIFKSKEIYSDFILPHPDRTRAFLKIQDGCDSFCTFCIIPFARGKSKSLKASFLIESLHKLEEAGIKEVVLTGVHIGDYKDEDKNLEDLIELLLKRTSLPRLRLTSLEPIEITDRLLDCYEDKRMCSHFHISLQSTNSKVLHSMKRKYSQKEVAQAFERIAKRQKKAFVGMDLITGFPTESVQDFEETYQFLKDHSWTNIHVFPYSSRKGTYSDFKYKALEQKEVKRRASLLRELSQNRFQKKLKEQIGTHKEVLLFNKDNTKSLSRDYWKVKLPVSSFKGEKEVLITGLAPDKVSLTASWCSSGLN